MIRVIINKLPAKDITFKDMPVGETGIIVNDKVSYGLGYAGLIVYKADAEHIVALNAKNHVWSNFQAGGLSVNLCDVEMTIVEKQ